MIDGSTLGFGINSLQTPFFILTPLPMSLVRQYSSRELAPKAPAKEENNEVNEIVETSSAQGLEPRLARMWLLIGCFHIWIRHMSMPWSVCVVSLFYNVFLLQKLFGKRRKVILKASHEFVLSYWFSMRVWVSINANRVWLKQCHSCSSVVGWGLRTKSIERESGRLGTVPFLPQSWSMAIESEFHGCFTPNKLGFTTGFSCRTFTHGIAGVVSMSCSGTKVCSTVYFGSASDTLW